MYIKEMIRRLIEQAPESLNLDGDSLQEFRLPEAATTIAVVALTGSAGVGAVVVSSEKWVDIAGTGVTVASVIGALAAAAYGLIARSYQKSTEPVSNPPSTEE